MKIFKALLLCAMFAGLQAQAAVHVTCTNGTIETVGDGLYTINIVDEGLEFQPYESGFTVTADKIMQAGNGVLIIANQQVAATSEGTEFTMLVDAMLLLGQDAEGNLTMKASVSTDKEGFRSLDMTCEQLATAQ